MSSPYVERDLSLQKLADFMRWDLRQHKQEGKDPSALNLSQHTDCIYWHPNLKSLANLLLLPRCTMMPSASRTLHSQKEALASSSIPASSLSEVFKL